MADEKDEVTNQKPPMPADKAVLNEPDRQDVSWQEILGQQSAAIAAAQGKKTR